MISDVEGDQSEAMHRNVSLDDANRSDANKAGSGTNKKESPLGSRNMHLPMNVGDISKQKVKKPRLIHPLLNDVPMQLRFGFNGFINNVLFMIAYNTAVQHFQNVDSSTVYSVVYLVFIPVGHACISLFVFGWPEHYFTSLMSNFPIGLTAIALGAALTSYLDKVHFNELTHDLIRQTWVQLGHVPDATVPLATSESGEFYSSLVVIFVTGIWTFVLSVCINAPLEQKEKKEQ